MASKREAHLKQKSLRGLILLHTLKISKPFFYKSSNEEFRKLEVNPILEKTVSFVSFFEVFYQFQCNSLNRNKGLSINKRM